MSLTRESVGFAEMEHFLRVTQYLYLKTICRNKNLRALYAKLCIALLRYSNEVRVDRAFYDAGIACREEGWLNLSFIFLNRYLDINDAIIDSESGGGALADTTDFEARISRWTSPPCQKPTSSARRKPRPCETSYCSYQSTRRWTSD